MADLVLYVHGKGGSAREAEHYRPLFPKAQVEGLDYRAATPWEAAQEFVGAIRAYKRAFDKITLIANSIGAFFSMCSGADALIERAFFISPIVDMESLITGWMKALGVSEETLREKKVIPTPFGETLSWEYLTRVRETPLRWNAPTDILYGSCDALTPRNVIEKFSAEHKARLTIMENGEHWFHTDEQMRFLDDWIQRRI